MSDRGGRSRERAIDLSRYRSLVPDWSAFTAAAARPEPTVVRVPRGRIEESELVARLERQGFRMSPVEGLAGFHRLDVQPFPVSATLEHWDGLLYVQQASTGVAAPALGAGPGERVLDLCSAPGGKTTHMAELMEGRGCVVASDIDERRIRGLLGNVYRLCHTNILTVACDGRDFPEGPLFDRVLVDVPCSGEGTLRRRAGNAPDQSESFLGYVRGVQRALLEKAVRLCRPDGTILYVTCTFSPEENEAVVSDVLAGGLVELEPLRLDLPHAPGLTSFEGARYDPRLEGAARIYPHHLDSGGLFLARLRRLEGEAAGEEQGSGDEPPSGDARWSPVPAAFPDGTLAELDARGLIERVLPEIAERYGVPLGTLEARGWIVRGGRIWTHGVEAWPLEAWRAGRWRPISVGLRAIELDSRGRPRPTNDLLRLLGPLVSRARSDLDRDRLKRLLDGGTEPAPMDLLGPVALALDGRVLGRGASTREGLVSEIPKARAADLRRVLSAEAS
jgi:16S rRNA C967 or C1407 C5-methylase (RsmB/RsmF family)